MQYFPEHRIACAFQVNTDVGVWDHSTELVSDMQRRLAQIVISYQQGKVSNLALASRKPLSHG
jgi:hypothetical protein